MTMHLARQVFEVVSVYTHVPSNRYFMTLSKFAESMHVHKCLLWVVAEQLECSQLQHRSLHETATAMNNEWQQHVVIV